MRAGRTMHGPRLAAGRRGGAGFTMPEVLATMLLIGIVVPVAMAGLSLALAAAGHARHTAQAATLGEAKLMELVATGQWMMATGSGDFSPDWPDYHWRSQMTTLDFDANQIQLQVTWTERGMEQSLSVTTIVYDNETSGTSSGTTGGSTTGSTTGGTR